MAESKGAAARRINDSIRYMQISVFSVGSALDSRRCDLVDEVERDLGAVKGDLVTRGWYDVGGLRADADVMVWWHSDESETLQAAYHALRATAFGQSLRPVWSVQALHRPAEFNKSHIPAFMADEHALDYVCVYPFVRSYEWYLLEDSNDVRCWPNTEPWPADTPMFAPTPSRPSLCRTTNGCWPSRPTSCTGSWISCGTCADRGRGCMCARRFRSTPGGAGAFRT